MDDIKIARNTKLELIEKIASQLGLQEDDIETYGKYKAKIVARHIQGLNQRKKGKIDFSYGYKSYSAW